RRRSRGTRTEAGAWALRPRGLRPVLADRPQLDIEVQRELRRGRPQPDRVQLLLDLVLDPGLDHVLGEDVALEEELVILLQLTQRFLERARHLRDVLQLFGGEAVDVLVERIARVDAV